MQFVEDDKLPLDVVRKEYSETRHALCCIESGFEFPFNPQERGAIGKPLYVLVEHTCAAHEE